MLIGYVLAAGFGSRLYPLSLKKANAASMQKHIPPNMFNINALPKPLVPVANLPITLSSLNMLRSVNAKEQTIHVSYMRNAFDGVFPDRPEVLYMGRDGAKKGVITDIFERIDAGFTGDIVILSCDIVSNIDIVPALKAHQKNKADVTIIATPITSHVTSCSPVVSQDPDSYDSPLISYRHKLQVDEARTLSRRRNSSVYIFSHNFFKELRQDKDVNTATDFSSEIFPWALATGKFNMLACNDDNLWADVGELHDYWDIQACWLEGKLKFPSDGYYVPPGEEQSFAGYRIVGPSLISKEVDIGRGAVIGPYAVIGNGWTIGNDTSIIGSTLWPIRQPQKMQASILRALRIQYCLIGSGAVGNDSNNSVIVSNGKNTLTYPFTPKTTLSSYKHSTE